VIDTSQIREGVGVAQQGVRQIQDSFRGMGQNVQQGMRGVGQAINGVGNDIRKLRTEIAAVTALAGGLVAIGINYANAMEEANIRFKSLLGSQERASALQVQLNQLADKYGLRQVDINKGAAQLLGTARGNTEEMERLLGFAVRLSVLNREQGIGGAAFAINEALVSGGTDLVSLAERFNLSRKRLQELTAQTGDFTLALDIALNEAGATAAAAEEMGESGAAAMTRWKDAVQRFLGEGMAPLLDKFLTPALDAGAEWLTQLTEQETGLVALSGGIIAATAVIGPLLLGLGGVINALKTIQGLSIAPALGRAGLVGAFAAGGVVAGLEASRGIGRATGNEELANADLGTLWNHIKQIIVVFADAIFRMAEATMQASAILVNAFGTAAEAIGGFVQKLGAISGMNDLYESGRLIKVAGAAAREPIAGAQERFDKLREEIMGGLVRGLFPTAGAESDIAMADGSADMGIGGTDFSQEQLDAWKDFREDLAKLEERAETERTKTVERAAEERQRITERIADAEKQAARAGEELGRRINAVQEDLAARETEIRQNLADKSAEIEEDRARRIEDIDRKLAQDLDDPAGKLDAIAVTRLQKAAENARQEAEIKAERALEDLEEEAENAEARLELARAEAGERIRDLQRAFEEEQRDRDEHIAKLRVQMAEVSAEEARRLEEIQTNLVNERTIRENAFVDEFNALTANEAMKLAVQQAGQEEALASLNEWWQRMKGVIEGGSGSAPVDRSQALLDYAAAQIKQVGGTQTGQYGGGGVYAFQHGGPVDTTGLAKVHAGEYVMNPETTSMLRSMLGEGFSQQQLVGALGGAGRSMNVNLGGIGPIAVSGSPAEMARQVADQVHDALVGIFRELAE
jgi:hypothetical protein